VDATPGICRKSKKPKNDLIAKSWACDKVSVRAWHQREMPPRGVRSWGLSGIFAAHMSDTARLTCRHQKRDAKKGGGDSENSGSSQRVPLGKLPAKSRANKNRSPVSQAARECVPVDKTCQQPRPHPHIYIYIDTQIHTHTYLYLHLP